MSFQPNPNQLQDLEQLFAVAANPAAGHHQQVIGQLQQMQSSTEFFAYCAFIVAMERDPSLLTVRQVAAYYLKTNLKSPHCFGNVAVSQLLFEALGDDSEHIRRAASSAISWAIANAAWSLDAVDKLIEGAANTSSAALAVGSLTTLAHVCEDAAPMLEESRRVQAVIPSIIPFLQHQDPVMRLRALQAVSYLLEEAGTGIHPPSCTYVSFRPFIPSILSSLSGILSSSAEDAVMQIVLRCLVLLLPFQEEIYSTFESIVQLMIQKTVSATDEVRMEAIEFWRAVLQFPRFAQATLPLMPQILPVLLDCMVYSEMELGMLNSQKDDWRIPDAVDEVKPRRFQAKAKRTHAHSKEDEEDNEEVEQWNLRMCAAVTLDDCAEHHGDIILNEVLTVVDKLMQQSQDWMHQEAGILALGAIAEGCFVGLQPYLVQIITQLLNLLEAEQTHNLVKAICCWTISRFAEWILADENQLLGRTVTAILSRMVSPSKRVQEAATTALGAMASFAGDELNVFAVTIVQTVSQCFQNYQLKNRYLLFETVESLCQCMQRRLAEEDCLTTLVEPLLRMWNETPNDSPLIFPFFSCVSAVASALGTGIQPMSEQIFTRSFSLIAYHVSARAEAKAANADPPEEEFLVTSMDLLGGLFEALGEAMATFIGQQTNFMSYILPTLVDESANIRQSGFALLADICGSTISLVQQNLPALLDPLLLNLKSGLETPGVASCIAWFLSDLCANQLDTGELPALNAQHAETLLPYFVQMVTDRSKHTAQIRDTIENSCLAIGILLQFDPSAIQRCQVPLSAFLTTWCEYTRNIKNIPSKDQALRGVLPVMQAAPTEVTSCLPHLFDLMLSLDRPAVEITNALVQVVASAKQVIGGNWQQYFSQYPQRRRSELYRIYGIQ